MDKAIMMETEVCLASG